MHVVAQESRVGACCCSRNNVRWWTVGSVPTKYTKYSVPAKVNNNPRNACLTTMDKRGLANLTTMEEINHAIFG